jgi:hypothetical protein
MNETILLPKGTRYWYRKKPEELEQERQKNEARGRFFDDAGEPVLYSAIGTNWFQESTLITVIKKRNVEWTHWSPKPKFLAEGLATINGLPKVVMFQNES